MLKSTISAERHRPQHAEFPPKHHDSRYNRCTLLLTSVVSEYFAFCFGEFYSIWFD